jgi:hypothetical protein
VHELASQGASMLIIRRYIWTGSGSLCRAIAFKPTNDLAPKPLTHDFSKKRIVREKQAAKIHQASKGVCASSYQRSWRIYGSFFADV